MSDVSIAYKGATIAALDAPGTKMLKTAGTYCESDIAVEYVPRSRTYEITLSKSSGWILLTELDEDVLAHIHDEDFTVMMARLGGYTYEWYAGNFYFAGNKPLGYHGEYIAYGHSNRLPDETSISTSLIYYPANNESTNTELGGFGMFRLDGNLYRLRPGDGFVVAGTYRLTFQW